MMTVPNPPMSVFVPLQQLHDNTERAKKLLSSDDPNEKMQGALIMSMYNSKYREEFEKSLDERRKEQNTQKAALLGARKAATKPIGYNSSTVFGGGQTEETGVILG